MSEGIAPFVSSTPPPFDEDNFRFEDDDLEDAYRDTSDENYIPDQDKTVFPNEIGKINYISKCSEDSKEEFEEFIDYQSSSNINKASESVNFAVSQVSNSLNQLGNGKVDNGGIECNEYDEFVTHEQIEEIYKNKDNLEMNCKTSFTNIASSTKSEYGDFGKYVVAEKIEEGDANAFTMKNEAIWGNDSEEDITHNNEHQTKALRVGTEITNETMIRSMLAEDDDFEEFVIHEDSKDNHDQQLKNETVSAIKSNWADDEFEEFVDSADVKAVTESFAGMEMKKEGIINSAEINNSLQDSSTIPKKLQDSTTHATIEESHGPLNSGIQQQPGENATEESWADFESFPEAFPAVLKDQEDEAIPHKPQECQDGGDDDFGGFEEALDDARPLYDTKKVLNDTFCLQSRTMGGHVSPLLELINANKGTDAGNKWSRIWNDLELIEKTPALNMKWKTSSLFQHFLKSVDISQHNVITSRQPNLPIFATNLCLLEPTKLHLGESLDTVEDGQASTNDIPKVEFDWANSVLMNPLDVGNVCHLDLDFFGDEVFASCVSPACKKEKELLESLEPSFNDPQKSLSLNSLLANMASNNTILIRNHSDCTISPQLKAILDKMPDLSFMQSRVLMFPVREEFIAESYS